MNTSHSHELPKLAYRVDEAVQASGLGKTTLYALMKDDRLPSIMVAGRRLILQEDLHEFLRSCRCSR